MAIYRLEAKIFSRKGRGRSVVAPGREQTPPWQGTRRNRLRATQQLQPPSITRQRGIDARRQCGAVDLEVVGAVAVAATAWQQHGQATAPTSDRLARREHRDQELADDERKMRVRSRSSGSEWSRLYL